MMGDEERPSPSVDKSLDMLLRWGLMARQEEGEETLYSVHTMVKEFTNREAEAKKANKKRFLARDRSVP